MKLVRSVSSRARDDRSPTRGEKTVALVVRTTTAPILEADASSSGRCAHCGRLLDPTLGRHGSRRRFCRPACREAARLRREQGLPEDHANRGWPPKLGRSQLVDLEKMSALALVARAVEEKGDASTVLPNTP